MSLIIKGLVWDSEFFGFNVARMECLGVSTDALSEAINICSSKGTKLIYIYLRPDDKISKLSVEHFGGQLVDKKITYVMNIASNIKFINNANIISSSNFSSKLESLALQSGEYSRFKIDTHFSSNVFENLYRQWLINSLNGLIADKVLVYKNFKNEEIGLLTLGRKDTRADIGLLAVDNEFRGKSIGQQLVHQSQIMANQLGYSEIQVVTQLDNILACKFYERCGFKIFNEEHVYHLWLK